VTGDDDDPTEPIVRPGAGALPEAGFRRIVDATAHPFVVIRSDGTVTYAGGSIVEAMGWQPDELLGRNIAEFVQPDQLALAVEAIDEITRVNRRAVGVPMVFGLRRPDGSTSWVQVGAFLLGMPGDDSVVLRLQVWDAQHHFDEFMATLLA
jgi:PAS domain S-box-containing protein